jgi:SAM-dependent methyltransferase
MDTYQEDTYGERIAGIYDDLYPDFDQAAIGTLQELAQGGRALELGIGTGRIALPLQESGVEVHGIDASGAMIARLRVTPGNFADVAVEGRFDLIYILVNTFYALLAQEEQVRCFQNVASHLTPSGVFVIEAFMPDLTRFQGRQTVRAIRVDLGEVHLEASQIDPASQRITTQHMLIGEQGARLYPVKIRYVWPAEFDLMARLAGMQLKHRWSSWQKEAFSAESAKHVSVFSL